MKPYRTLATIRLFTGKIGLRDEQVKWRENCLSKIEDNVYEIIDEVVFKAGETIGLEYVPKPHSRVLKCLEPESAEVEEKTVVKDEMKIEVKQSVPKKRGRKPAKAKV